MTNFIFKSVSTDLQKISQQLKVILDNQKYTRIDLARVEYKVTQVLNAKRLQKQVDDFYDKSDYEDECTDSGPSAKTDLD